MKHLIDPMDLSVEDIDRLLDSALMTSQRL